MAQGNGLHIHLSFQDGSGSPATYDADRPGRLALVAGQFAAAYCVTSGDLRSCRAHDRLLRPAGAPPLERRLGVCRRPQPRDGVADPRAD